MDIRLQSKNDPEQIIQVLDQHWKEVLEPQGQWIPIDADGNPIEEEVVEKIMTSNQISEMKAEMERMAQALKDAEQLQEAAKKKSTTKTKKAKKSEE